jgi:hypothetical protein
VVPPFFESTNDGNSFLKVGWQRRLRGGEALAKERYGATTLRISRIGKLTEDSACAMERGSVSGDVKI